MGGRAHDLRKSPPWTGKLLVSWNRTRAEAVLEIGALWVPKPPTRLPPRSHPTAAGASARRRGRRGSFRPVQRMLCPDGPAALRSVSGRPRSCSISQPSWPPHSDASRLPCGVRSPLVCSCRAGMLLPDPRQKPRATVLLLWPPSPCWPPPHSSRVP